MKKSAKTLILITLASLTFSFINAQTDLPDSRLNVGVGLGVNYGLLGTKTVIGKKNSGLLLGLGLDYFGGLGWEVGGQVSYKFMYANLGYGTVTGTRTAEGNEMWRGYNFTFGGMIGLGKQQRTFIDLGVGYSYVPADDYLFPESRSKFFSLVAGVGYRFGGS